MIEIINNTQEASSLRFREALQYGYDQRPDKGEASENSLIRLAFHDCVRYKDKSGGCDGCLNWKNINYEYKDIFDHQYKYYAPQVNEGDNVGMARLVGFLEVLYTTIDFPSSAPSLKVSLKDSGKSRADLWAFAGMVALEKSIERANWACEYDFNMRQQQTLLEGREKCDIKITKPVKFMHGRIDCIPPNPQLPYITDKEENQALNFGTAENVLEYMKEEFKMPAREFIALSAIHGQAGGHGHTLGTKYVWFGSSYLGNMYFKMIANKPTYIFEHGGSPAFMAGNTTYFSTSVGDVNGNPLPTHDWRVSCQPLWNTTEGGPCFMRPTSRVVPDGPIEDAGVYDCAESMDENGNIILKNTTNKDRKNCVDATFDKNGIQIGGKQLTHQDHVGSGWNNMFALPYEIGLHRKFDITGPAHRPTGCPGINIALEDYPYNQGEFSVQSPTTGCDRNYYSPEGIPIYMIVEEFADDQDVWSESFFDGWQIMQRNGYDDLKDGPQESWLGYDSLESE